MTNSADPDQLANSSGSTLFAMTGHILFSKRRVKFFLCVCDRAKSVQIKQTRQACKIKYSGLQFIIHVRIIFCFLHK